MPWGRAGGPLDLRVGWESPDEEARTTGARALRHLEHTGGRARRGTT